MFCSCTEDEKATLEAEENQEILSLEPSKGSSPSNSLTWPDKTDFELLASRTIREEIYIVLSPTVCSLCVIAGLKTSKSSLLKINFFFAMLKAIQFY